MIKLVSADTIETENLEYDVYLFEEATPISRKDVTVVVCFTDNQITGDCVAHGQWFDISKDECIPYLNSLSENEIVRPFKHMY